MDITHEIREAATESLTALYGQTVSGNEFQINLTKPEFEGDYTIVLFSLLKSLKKPAEALGNELGTRLVQHHPRLFSSYNIIKGFLNLSVRESYWIQFLRDHYSLADYGKTPSSGHKVMVEYSSPNTNKPLHLGHLRNNFLGWSCAEILKASGCDTIKTCIVNDRGIHICKSMIAWEMLGNGATPQSTGMKGDHFVGDYYVKFNDLYKEQVAGLVAGGMEEETAKKQAPVMLAAQQMLVDWEAGKPEVIALWKKMNGWVYEGFDATYRRIGSDFDKIYYESETYLLGKALVEKGLDKKVFYKKDDGSAWIDLRDEGLDEKLVQRKDGTAVYITQDIGLVEQKQQEFNLDESIYVVGDEQNYHFKVLKLICQKLKLPASDNIYHLSYGMVELPTGKMKSREGSVVDADDLVDEMIAISRQKTEELGKVKDFTDSGLQELYEIIGIGALKFFLLRVDPKKKMIFNPEESIDFHGFTGPFIQYTYARIKSILRKMENPVPDTSLHQPPLLALEKKLIILLEQFPAVIRESASGHDPSKIAIFVFNLAQAFNTFYTQHSIAGAETPEKRSLRLQLGQLTAQVIQTGMSLLGIHVPERM